MNLRFLLAISFLIHLTVLGCGNQAKDLFETAQFEERQNNQAHARELYEQIVKQYPETDFAKNARERLAALTPDRNPAR